MKLFALLVLVACGGAKPESLDLPADPSSFGVPVGVATEVWAGRTVEIWYPASDDVAGEPTEDADFDAFVPASVTALLGPVDLPAVPTRAVRDAPFRRLEDPVPAIVFSHGFGGTRTQSVTLAVHLASRGYVVLSTDHTGRSMTDLLPCLFNPPAAGCNLSGFGADPGATDVPALLDALAVRAAASDGLLAGRVNLDKLGLFGHSAGGNTTTTVGAVDARLKALAPMAGGGPVDTSAEVVYLAGTCDGIVAASSTSGAASASGRSYAAFPGAGHLAFSDLCALELDRVADDLILGRDDLNQTLVPGLLALGTDGCAAGDPVAVLDDPSDCVDGYWLPEAATPSINHVLTSFFDAALRGVGPGVVAGAAAGVDVTVRE